MEVEFAAVKEDPCAVVGEVSETPGVGLERLDFGVEAFADGIGDGVLEIGQDVFKVLLDHPGHFEDWLETTTTGPTKPFPKEFTGRAFLMVAPKAEKEVLDGPSARGVQSRKLKVRECRFLLRIHLHGIHYE